MLTGATRRLRSVRFSVHLEFLSRSVSSNRHYDCNEFLEKSGVAPRVDAQASSTRTGIGGWFSHPGKNGGVDRWRLPWFSLEMSREAFPWVSERGNKPALDPVQKTPLQSLCYLRFPITGKLLGFEQADEHEISFVRAPDGVV